MYTSEAGGVSGLCTAGRGCTEHGTQTRNKFNAVQCEFQNWWTCHFVDGSGQEMRRHAPETGGSGRRYESALRLGALPSTAVDCVDRLPRVGKAFPAARLSESVRENGTWRCLGCFV